MRIVKSLPLLVAISLTLAACKEDSNKITFPDGATLSVTDKGTGSTIVLTLPDGTVRTRISVDIGSQPTDCEYRGTIFGRTKVCKRKTPSHFLVMEKEEKDGVVMSHTITYPDDPELSVLTGLLGPAIIKARN